MDEFCTQEITSTYFNNIILQDVKPITVEELSPTALDNFNRQIEIAFTDEAGITKKRIHYLVPYILQNIDWGEYALPLEAWQIRY